LISIADPKDRERERREGKIRMALEITHDKFLPFYYIYYGSAAIKWREVYV
jgi:hypothetical protein